MGKKSFIDKKNSQKFQLLHRSQLDQAHAQEGTPSEFVLVPVENIVQTRNATLVANPMANLKEKFHGRGADHINELGFKNDGYDYAQHMKQMGGGKFIGKDGKVGEAPRYLELPEDALPSTGMDLKRDLAAITISDEFMDPDLYAALFEEEDEEGEFEALDDDFVEQVMQEPEVPDFDFDAHIAALIAKSEQSLGFNKARGWDDAKSRKMKPMRNKTFEDADFDDILEDDEDDEDDEDNDDESGEFDVDELMAGGEVKERPSRRHVDSERQAALDMQFEKALEEYDDDQIGDLEDEAEDSDMDGEIDLEDLEKNDVFNQILDEYLQDQKDRVLAEGTHVKKGSRNVLLLKKTDNDQYTHEELHKVDVETPVDVTKAYREQIAQQQDWAEQIEELKEGAKEYEKDIATCQEYLRRTQVDDVWDCETIISTYSTLDNHPTVIRDANSKFKPYKNKFLREQEQVAAMAYSDTASLASSSKRSIKSSSISSSNNNSAAMSIQKGKIVLSGKLNLPEGFAPGKNHPVNSYGHGQGHGLSVIQERVEDDNDDSASESEEDSESENEGEAGEGVEGEEDKKRKDDWEEREKKVKARKKETAEEKKARKAATKEARKVKRTSKKQLKSMFKQEGVSLIRNMASEQTINHVSVFKYSH